MLEAQSIDQGQAVGPQLLALLRGQIVRGTIPPGARLSEAGVARDYEVSRQPVREIFIRLAEEGLLEIRPQRGSVVPKMSVRKALEARFIREAIEADVVKLAATELTEDQISELEDLLAQQRKAKDVHHFIQLDDAFHRGLAEGVGRGHAWRVVEGLKVHLDRVRHLSFRQFPMDTTTEQHADVVAAIRARDPQAAEAAMRLHLQAIVEDLEVIAADLPDYFEDA